MAETAADVLDRCIAGQEETVQSLEKDLAAARGNLNGLILARNVVREFEKKGK